MRFCIITLVSLVASSSFSSEWPQFRGPQGNGVVTESGHPTQWSATENVAWSAGIPGGGWSSPVVANDRVFITTAVSLENVKPKGFGAGVASMRSFSTSQPPESPVSFEVHCLSLSDGEVLWRQVVASQTPPHKIHPSNSYATESPATDGQRVYVYFAAIGVVACLDQDGNQNWKRELGAFPTANDFGTGSSLAILDDRVFVQCDNHDKSFLVALDASTGTDVGRKERSGKTSWSSPIIWRNQNRTELVVCGAGDVVSYDPENGAVNWSLTGTGGAFSASPTADRERIYFGKSGRTSRGPLIAVHANASGELNQDGDSIGDGGVAWIEQASAPGMSSPVVVDDRVFVVTRGIISCHDAVTGKRLYRTRLPDAARVAASLWAADGLLFVLDESGRTSVIQVADEFKLVNTNPIDGLYWSTPSFARNALLLRGANILHCVKKSSEMSASSTSAPTRSVADRARPAVAGAIQ